MMEEPYAVTPAGLVWLIETRSNQKVLRFPWVSPSSTETLSVWRALEKIRDPNIARVELAPKEDGYVPYVGFSVVPGQEGVGQEGVGQEAVGISTLLFDGGAAAKCFQAAGLDTSALPAATVLTGRVGKQMLVCSAVAMSGVRGWAPLANLVGSPAHDSFWANQRGGRLAAHHPF